MADTTAAPAIVPGRSCEGCAMCCYLAKVESLDKPAGVWCPHCPTKRACEIHGDHPDECRAFNCGWLTVESLGDAWRPSKSRIVMTAELDGARITALVDPLRPDAWRKAPFYDQFKAWAQAALAHDGQVVIRIGRRAIVVLTDEDVDLGEVADDEAIVTEITMGPAGKKHRALKLHRSDPRAANLP